MTNNDIIAAYMGVTEAEKIYLGSELIYENRVPYEQQYLTIETESGGTLNVNRENIDYSINKGAWQTTSAATGLALNPGDVVRFRAIPTSPLPALQPGYGLFSASTLDFVVYGNAESLEYGDNFVGQTTMVATASTFSRMFHSCTGLTDASNLILPAETLVQGCYYSMFYDCHALSGAPELNASSVPRIGYAQMFYGCNALNYIKCLATSIYVDTTGSTGGTYRWTRYVASTGTFVRDSGMTWTINDASNFDGIPSGWTIDPPYPVQVAPVLNIGGQQIQGTDDGYGGYNWNLSLSPQNGPFTITSGGTPITASTYIAQGISTSCAGTDGGEGGWDDENQEWSDTKEEYDVSQFTTLYPIYSINYYYGEVNAYTDYYNCPCDDWDPMVYSSYEDCMCQNGASEYCEEPGGDPCDDWAGNGYSSWEECTCAQYGENCEEPEP